VRPASDSGGSPEESVRNSSTSRRRRLLALAVAGEERRSGDLGKVGEREDRPVEIGHIRREALLFLGREGLDVVVGDHRRNSTDRRG
jgi:hypothetical protein